MGKRPRRKVVESEYVEGEISFLRPGERKTRWWELKLECGHEINRRVTKKQIIDDLWPHYAYCEECEELK